jgi:hypothetical protein
MASVGNGRAASEPSRDPKFGALLGVPNNNNNNPHRSHSGSRNYSAQPAIPDSLESIRRPVPGGGGQLASNQRVSRRQENHYPGQGTPHPLSSDRSRVSMAVAPFNDRSGGSRESHALGAAKPRGQSTPSGVMAPPANSARPLAAPTRQSGTVQKTTYSYSYVCETCKYSERR